VNLIKRWPGPSASRNKGDAFPLERAARAAARLELGDGPVILLGKGVAGAFGARADFFEWFELRGRRAVVIPHPSGVSRWWNEPANRRRASRFIRSVLA
jgi:hypothetical protein